MRSLFRAPRVVIAGMPTIGQGVVVPSHVMVAIQGISLNTGSLKPVPSQLLYMKSTAVSTRGVMMLPKSVVFRSEQNAEYSTNNHQHMIASYRYGKAVHSSDRAIA